MPLVTISHHHYDHLLMIVFSTKCVIKTEEDTSQQQCDLDQLSQWAQTWQMEFNHSKCTVIKCTIIISFSNI